MKNKDKGNLIAQLCTCNYPCPVHAQPAKTWEKQFYTRFVRFNSTTGFDMGLHVGIRPEDIISFFRQELAKQKRELLERIEKKMFITTLDTEHILIKVSDWQKLKKEI